MKRPRTGAGCEMLRIPSALGTWFAFVLLVSALRADIVVTSIRRIECRITSADSNSVVMDLPLGGTKTISTKYVLELLVDDPERESSYRRELTGSGVRVGSSLGQYPTPQPQHAGTVRSEMVFEAGKHLESARALAFWSVGAAVAASIASALLAGNTQVDGVLRVGIPVGLDLVSFICGLVAWGEVGQAGTMMAWSKGPPED